MAPRKEVPKGVQLSAAERKTYDRLFRHPAPHDLAWLDVIELLRRLAEIYEGRKGNYKVTRHGVMTTLRAPRLSAALTPDELGEVRSYLERSEAGGSQAIVAEGTRLLVSIDTGGARIYRLEFVKGRPKRLLPFESNGYAAHLRTTAGVESGPEPLRLGFYRDLARALRGAEEILLVAGGDGGEEALADLRAGLRREDAEIHRSLVGGLVHPGRRTTEQQLLARALEFYAARD